MNCCLSFTNGNQSKMSKYSKTRNFFNQLKFLTLDLSFVRITAIIKFSVNYSVQVQQKLVDLISILIFSPPATVEEFKH